MKQLSLGIQTFEKLRKMNCVYVDKTAIIRPLLDQSCLFLARPRRFGKSLLISTFEAIFQGRKDLFDDLAISKTDWAWPVHPVIRLDFSMIPRRTIDTMTIGINAELDSIARRYNIDLSQQILPETKLPQLVRQLAQQNSVVILIDEYDKPILDHIHNSEKALEMRNFLSEFYGTFKSLDPYIKMIFFTGITKFSRLSIFSGLNNLNDISEKPESEDLLGYTDQELSQFFVPHLERLAEREQSSVEVVVAKMKLWYDGYRFCTSQEGNRLYAPLSVLYCLQDCIFSNYWFGSGTPSYLAALLKTQNYDLSWLATLVTRQIGDAIFNTFNLENLHLEALLYQAGYLTIASSDTTRRLVDLKYPNAEVRESMSILLLGMSLDSDELYLRPFIENIRTALSDCDIPRIEKELQGMLASIPYKHHKPDESLYHSILQAVFYVLGYDVQSEDTTHTGLADIVIRTPSCIYIFELKVDETASMALQQILEKRYYEKYQQEGKSLVLVGLAFRHKDKKLTVQHEVMIR